MKTIALICATLTLPLAALSEAPTIQTQGAIIHLADNLDEAAMLGWCIDTEGRGLSDQLHAHSCKPTGGDVLFIFAAETGAIASATYDNKCMALNAPENAKNPFGLIDCDATAPNQTFIHDAASMEIRIGTDDRQCLTVSPAIDDAGPFQSRDLIFAACDALDPSFKQWVIQN